MIRLGDPLSSSRATYALGRVAAASVSGKIPRSAIKEISEGLHEAAQSKVDLVRVAAAAATHGLPSGEAAPIQLALLDDPDVGVRRTVLEALKADAKPPVVARIEKLANEEPNKEMKELALAVLKECAGSTFAAHTKLALRMSLISAGGLVLSFSRNRSTPLTSGP